MKLYFASGMPHIKRLYPLGVRRILSSWIEDKQEVMKEYSDLDIMLDSGAFSAFTRGVKINIDDYIAYIKEHGFKVYASLDVIGNAEESKRNNEYMRSKGLVPIPAYHYGEDESYLEFYCKNYPYIALGGVAQLRTPTRVMKWLDNCFSVIKNYKTIKIHGFAITSPRLMKRYPFYSVDSTGWLQGGIFGRTKVYKNMKLQAHSLDLFYNKTKDYKFRNTKNIIEYLKLEKEMTKLWEMRGFIWKE